MVLFAYDGLRSLVTNQLCTMVTLPAPCSQHCKLGHLQSLVGSCLRAGQVESGQEQGRQSKLTQANGHISPWRAEGGSSYCLEELHLCKPAFWEGKWQW